jgi:uncharacterized spore protein YtfJ
MEDPYPSGERILAEIGARVASAAHVNAAFGEPSQVGDATIVPVAAVLSMFVAGGGGGAGKQGDGEAGKSANTGAGGGGGGMAAVRVRPLAVVRVTPSGATVQPIIDWTRVLIALIAALATFLGLRGLRQLFRR